MVLVIQQALQQQLVILVLHGVIVTIVRILLELLVLVEQHGTILVILHGHLRHNDSLQVHGHHLVTDLYKQHVILHEVGISLHYGVYRHRLID